MGFAESPYVLVRGEGLLEFAGATDGTVVWRRDEHDAFTGDGLEAIMGRAIELDDADVVIDSSGVEFMDSATVRVINRTRESLMARSQSLTWRFRSTWARRVLGLYSLGDGLVARRVHVTASSPSPSSDRTGVAGRAGR